MDSRLIGRLRQRRVIFGRDGAANLVAEGKGRELFDFRHRLRLDASIGCERIARRQLADESFAKDDVAQRILSDVTRLTYPDAVLRGKHGFRIGHASDVAVAEA